MRIIVADDRLGLRQLLRATLNEHEVLDAADGATALTLIRREHPDLAVLDNRMPGLTGIEVAEALAGDPATAGIPLFVCTGLPDEVLSVCHHLPNIRAVLPKPYSPATLRQAVERLTAG